jgi:hypothetical protein
MKNKKSIVLLITIFFIAAFSALLIKNLQDSEKFIDISQTPTNLAQTNISISNINTEILNLFKNKKNDLDLILNTLPDTIPLVFEGIQLNISFEKINHDNFLNINNPTFENKIYSDLELNENINYPFDIAELTKERDIKNFRQIDDIIQEYIQQTKDDKILNIQNRLSFQDYNESNTTYISCDYDIDIYDLKSKVNMIIQINENNNSKSKISYFDFYTVN